MVDPWGGSYHVEALTQELITKARGHLAEVEKMGDMSRLPRIARTDATLNAE